MATALEGARRLRNEAEEERSFVKAGQALHLYQQAIREASYAQKKAIILEQGVCYELKQKLEQEKKSTEATGDLRSVFGTVPTPTATDRAHHAQGLRRTVPDSATNTASAPTSPPQKTEREPLGTSSWMKPVVGLIVVMVTILCSFAGYQYVTSLAREDPQPGVTPGPRTPSDPGPLPDTTNDCTPINDKVELTNALAVIGDWVSLCYNLRVNEATMAQLGVSGEPEVNKKRQCLHAYIDQGDACWEKVIKVVAGYPFFNVRLARDIAKNHGMDPPRLLDEL